MFQTIFFHASSAAKNSKCSKFLVNICTRDKSQFSMELARERLHQELTDQSQGARERLSELVSKNNI